jgi:peptidyl-tRNA hydrolase, PTH1 family
MIKLIVGLGNPGRQYEKNRHNLGWLALEKFKDVHAPEVQWKAHGKAKAEFCEVWMNEQKLILFKPLTYMNKSGKAVQDAMQFHKIEASEILVLHDEVDLDFGRIKITEQAGPAGNNGIKSIIKYLGSNQFLRLRLGVKTKKLNRMPTDKFVLQNFGLFEKGKVKKWLPSIVDAIHCLLEEDAVKCMNQFH